MFRKILLITLLIPNVVHSASDIWVNDQWKDKFILGLWEGCMMRTLNASDYLVYNDMPTGIEFRDSQHPTLVAIKNACDCQTNYFQDNYSNEELKRILSLGSQNKEYVELIGQVGNLCL